MSHSILIQAGTTFTAGMLASLSPCVYPLLPMTIGYIGSRSPDRANRALGWYVMGQVLAFTAMGVITVELGETLGFSSESRWLNISVGLFLLLMGAASFRGFLPPFLQHAGNRIWVRVETWDGARSPVRQALIALGLGASAALVASPCTTPILGGVLTMIASSGTVARGSALMLFYSLGFSAILALVAGGLVSIKRLPRSGPWLSGIHRVSVALLFASGLYYLFKGIPYSG